MSVQLSVGFMPYRLLINLKPPLLPLRFAKGVNGMNDIHMVAQFSLLMALFTGLRKWKVSNERPSPQQTTTAVSPDLLIEFVFDNKYKFSLNNFTIANEKNSNENKIKQQRFQKYIKNNC